MSFGGPAGTRRERMRPVGFLEREPNCQLQLAREVRLPGNLSKSTARKVGVRRIEIRRVEGVERFRPELRLQSLFNREVLEDGDIPVLLTGTA